MFSPGPKVLGCFLRGILCRSCALRRRDLPVGGRRHGAWVSMPVTLDLRWIPPRQWIVIDGFGIRAAGAAATNASVQSFKWQYALIQRKDATGPQWPETPDLLRRRK